MKPRCAWYRPDPGLRHSRLRPVVVEPAGAETGLLPARHAEAGGDGGVVEFNQRRLQLFKANKRGYWSFWMLERIWKQLSQRRTWRLWS